MLRALPLVLLFATVSAHAAPSRPVPPSRVAAPARKSAPAQPTVTLDVKDADIRVILKSMQKQCGIKNLLLDPDVQGTGTFLFRALPCRTAFDVVFRSAGLAGTLDGSVVSASARR